MSGPARADSAEQFTRPAWSREVAWVTPARLGWTLFVSACVLLSFCLLYFPPLYVLLAVCATAGAALLVFYPFLGVLAYVVFEYMRIPATFPFVQPLQLGKVVILATLLSWLFHVLVLRKAKPSWDPIHWLLLGWSVIGFLSVVVARDSTAAMDTATDLAKWAVVYMLFVQLTDTKLKWQWLLWTLILLNLKISQSQHLAYIRGFDLASDSYRFVTEGVGIGTGFLVSATDFGAAMCIVVPLALHVARASRHASLRVLGWISVVAFSLSILRSGSRGAFVAMVAVAIAYWLRSPRKLLTGSLVLSGLVLFLAAAPVAWESRLQRAADYESDPTASARIRLWQAGLAMFLEEPLTGVGIANFPATYELIAGHKKAPHSIWVQAGAELGVFGLALLMILIYQAFRRNAQTRGLPATADWGDYARGSSLALELSFLAFLVSGSFVTILYYPHVFIILTLIVSLHRVSRLESEASERAASTGQAALAPGGPSENEKRPATSGAS